MRTWFDRRPGPPFPGPGLFGTLLFVLMGLGFAAAVGVLVVVIHFVIKFW